MTDRWAGQGSRRQRKEPITVDRIVRTALEMIEAEGYDAVTMRRVAAALHTGPASLYAHVRNKADLDDLLIGELCSRIRIPDPDPAHWRQQIVDVCGQLRDQYLRYPGISSAPLASAPDSLDTMRITEGLLAIMLAGDVEPRAAAWTIDALLLYIAAYGLESSLRTDADDRRTRDRAETIARLQSLPPERFPAIIAHAREMTSGEGHERFDFTLEALLRGVGD